MPGHFPGRPVVPGVVVLDQVLQALAQQGWVEGALRLPQVKFLQPLLPDQSAEILLEHGPVAGQGPWRFQVTSEGRTIATGRIENAQASA
ncbi:MAG TPA: hypothetical protein VGC74_13185 [Stenotrophomonas sp.]